MASAQERAEWDKEVGGRQLDKWVAVSVRIDIDGDSGVKSGM